MLQKEVVMFILALTPSALGHPRSGLDDYIPPGGYFLQWVTGNLQVSPPNGRPSIRVRLATDPVKFQIASSPTIRPAADCDW